MSSQTEHQLTTQKPLVSKKRNRVLSEEAEKDEQTASPNKATKVESGSPARRAGDVGLLTTDVAKVASATDSGVQSKCTSTTGTCVVRSDQTDRHFGLFRGTPMDVDLPGSLYFSECTLVRDVGVDALQWKTGQKVHCVTIDFYKEEVLFEIDETDKFCCTAENWRWGAGISTEGKRGRRGRGRRR